MNQPLDHLRLFQEWDTRLTGLMGSFRELSRDLPEARNRLQTFFQELFSLQGWFQENREKLSSSAGVKSEDDRYEWLYKSSLILDAAMDQPDLLRLALDTVLEMCEGGRGFITVLRGEALEVVAARNFEKQDIPQPEHQISYGVIERVKTLQREVHVAAETADESLLQRSSLLQREGGALICVPIIVDGGVMGAIYIDRFPGGISLGRFQLVRHFSLQLASFLKTASSFSALRQEREKLLDDLHGRYRFEGILGRDKAMLRILKTVAKVAATEVAVLIQGETGTGKDLIARAIHRNSPRSRGPYIEVDCGALPANLVESELFGHVKGAFTGAQADRVGLMEAAHGGTLFLDEINNLPSPSQTKLLRALQQRRIRRLGETRERQVDFRLVAASSKDLEALVAQDAFRQDLFYRINTVAVTLPPLRNRKQDLILLAEAFLQRQADAYGRPALRFHADVLTALEGHQWPGNVRELEHVIERAVILCEGDRVCLEDLPFQFHGVDPWQDEEEEVGLEQFLNRTKKYYIARVIQESQGNKAEAARRLKVNRSYLFQLIKQLEI